LVRRLCEAQKYMLFSFTSCGWFFADISGIETVQNLMYACAPATGIFMEEREAALENFWRGWQWQKAIYPIKPAAASWKPNC